MRRNIVIASISIVVAVCLLVLFLVPGLYCKLFPPNARSAQVLGPHESPIEVAGGSLIIKAAKGFQRCHFLSSVYCAVTDDTKTWHLDGIGLNPPTGAPKGWVISLSNKVQEPDTGKYSEHQDAVRLCTDINCSLADPVDDKIYVKISKGSKWIKNSWICPTELRFHDAPHCGGTAENKNCDNLFNVRIRVAGEVNPGGKPQPRACNNGAAGKCTIGIGTLAP